jgi:hypothetical protein
MQDIFYSIAIGRFDSRSTGTGQIISTVTSSQKRCKYDEIQNETLLTFNQTSEKIIQKAHHNIICPHEALE